MTIKDCIFTVESLAHLQGKEAQLLPIAEAAKKEHDALLEAVEVLEELHDIVQGHLDDGDELDSLTLQPARAALAKLKGVNRSYQAALQSQDREDALRYRYLTTKLQQAYDGERFESECFSAYYRMSYHHKGNRTILAEIAWCDKSDEPIGLDEAIDHARRIERDGE